MSMIPKEIDSNFGQDGQKHNVCDNDAQNSFFIDRVFPVAGELHCGSHDLAARDQTGNLHFYFHPDCYPVTGTTDNENSATNAHTLTFRQSTSHGRNAYPGR